MYVRADIDLGTSVAVRSLRPLRLRRGCLPPREPPPSVPSSSSAIRDMMWFIEWLRSRRSSIDERNV